MSKQNFAKKFTIQLLTSELRKMFNLNRLEKGNRKRPISWSHLHAVQYSGKAVYYTVHNCHILLLCYKRNKHSEININTLCLFVWLINMFLFPEGGKYINMCNWKWLSVLTNFSFCIIKRPLYF